MAQITCYLKIFDGDTNVSEDCELYDSQKGLLNISYDSEYGYFLNHGELHDWGIGYVLYNNTYYVWDNSAAVADGETYNVLISDLALDDNKFLNRTGLAHLIGKMKASFITSAPVTSVNGKTGAVVLDIPTAVTEETVSNWGFTKNTGTYSKPSGGIPASDIADGVIPDVSNFITKSVSDLANYYTKSETYMQTEVQQLINTIKQFTYESVNTLPTASASTMNKIYLVPSSQSKTQNVKDEYITLNNNGSYSWEQIGSTAIDLSGYVTTDALNSALANYTTSSDLTTILSGYQKKITSSNKLDYSLLSNTPSIPAAPGKLDTTNTTAQSVSSSESLSGTVKLHKIAKTGAYGDLLNAPDLSLKQNKSDKVTSISDASTDEQYPSAKAVYDFVSSAPGGGNVIGTGVTHIVSITASDYEALAVKDPETLYIVTPDAAPPPLTGAGTQEDPIDGWLENVTTVINPNGQFGELTGNIPGLWSFFNGLSPQPTDNGTHYYIKLGENYIGWISVYVRTDTQGAYLSIAAGYSDEAPSWKTNNKLLGLPDNADLLSHDIKIYENDNVRFYSMED